MKYLFWIAVILLVWWAWRRARGQSTGASPTAQTPPQSMVSCAHCGLHLPRNEAVAGANGQYCSPAHRSAAGDHNPD